MSKSPHDPMMRRTDDGLKDSPLFGTSYAAALVAAQSSPRHRARILQLLALHGELALPDLCKMMRVTPNQISGRLSDLCRDGEIEPTGKVRDNPATHCPCSIYRLRVQCRP